MSMQKSEWIQKIFSKHRLFLAGVFVFAALAHLPYIVPGGPSACYPNPLFLVIDEGTVLYDSFRITFGEVIYRDFFIFHGPVFFYINAGLFAVTGPSIEAARALNLLITALSATLIALLIARSLGPIAGAGAAVVHACLLVPIYPYAYPHWLAEAFAFGGIYLLTTSSGRPSRDLAGGACLGLSAATIQSLGLPILAACMAVFTVQGILQHNWRETLVRPFRVFGGALLSISPFIFYLSGVGALGEMWYATVEWVFNYYAEGQKDAWVQGYGAYLDTFVILHRTVGQPWQGLASFGLRFVRLLPIFAICGVIVTTMQVILNRGRQSLDTAHQMISTAAMAATIPLLLGITRFDIGHIAFVGSFGLCGAAIVFSSLVNWKPRLRLSVVAVWVFVGILVIVNFSAKTIMTYRPSRNMKDWRGEILKLGMAIWIDTYIGPNERIVTTFGGLEYLYIRRAAVGFSFLPFDTPNCYSDEQWRKIGSQILKTLPPVIEVTKDQWLQILQRTPKLAQIYRLVNNRFLLREGFNPYK